MPRIFLSLKWIFSVILFSNGLQMFQWKFSIRVKEILHVIELMKPKKNGNISFSLLVKSWSFDLKNTPSGCDFAAVENLFLPSWIINADKAIQDNKTEKNMYQKKIFFFLLIFRTSYGKLVYFWRASFEFPWQTNYHILITNCKLFGP